MRLLLVKICAIAAVNLVAGGAQAEAPNVSINSARALQLYQNMKHLRTHSSPQHDEDERGFDVTAALGEAMEKYSSSVLVPGDNAFKSALKSGYFNEFFKKLFDTKLPLQNVREAMKDHQKFAALWDAYASYVNKIHTDPNFVNKKRFNTQPVQPTLAGYDHSNLDLTLAQPGQPKLAQPGQPKLAQPGQPKLAQPIHPSRAGSVHPNLDLTLAQHVHNNLDLTLAQPGQPKLAQLIHPTLAQPVHPTLAGSVHPNLDLTLAQHVHDNLDLTLAQPRQPKLAQPVQARRAQPNHPTLAQPVHPTLAGSVHLNLDLTLAHPGQPKLAQPVQAKEESDFSKKRKRDT